MNKNNPLIHIGTNGNPNIIGGGMTGTGRSVIESINDKYPTIEDLVEVLKEKGHNALADQLTYAAENSKMFHPELITGSAESGKTAELPMAKTGVGMSFHAKKEFVNSIKKHAKKRDINVTIIGKAGTGKRSSLFFPEETTDLPALPQSKDMDNMLSEYELSKERPSQRYLYKTMSNNWLKRHGYPMRRRPFNERDVLLLDETYLLANDTTTTNYTELLFSTLRKYKKYTVECTQHPEGYEILEHYKEPEHTADEIMTIFKERMKTSKKDGTHIHFVNQRRVFDETGKMIGIVMGPAELLIYKKKDTEEKQ